MLNRIDPFKDLGLTSADMPQFLEELSVVAAEATSREERGVVRKLRALAEQCRDDPGLILLFTGD